MKPEVSAAINKTSAAAAAIAAVLSPVPMADELVMLPLFGFLARRIAREHGLSASKTPWRPLFGTAVKGLAARAAVNLAVAFVPGVAAVANATSAVGLTQWFGRFADEVCGNPAAQPPGLESLFTVLKIKRPIPARPA
jgi:uncharacterized protein (DUF697 family)